MACSWWKDHLSYLVGNYIQESSHVNYNRLRNRTLRRKYFYKFRRNKLVDSMGSPHHRNIQVDIPRMDFQCIPLIENFVLILKL